MCKYDVWCINYPQKEFHLKINNSRGFVVSGEGSGLVTISWKVGAISLISPSLSKQKKHLQFYEFLRILHWTRGSSCRIIKPVYLLSKHVPSFPNYSLHSLSLSFGKKLNRIRIFKRKQNPHFMLLTSRSLFSLSFILALLIVPELWVSKVRVTWGHMFQLLLV